MSGGGSLASSFRNSLINHQLERATRLCHLRSAENRCFAFFDLKPTLPKHRMFGLCVTSSVLV